MEVNKINVTIDDSVDLEDVEQGTYIMLQMDNGEQLFGLFQFVDGDTIALKPKTEYGDGTALGWPLDRVSFWGFVEQD